MDANELTNLIRRGEIDINNHSLFFSILTKGLLVKLRQDIKIRKEEVPHYILNTGDEIMALEVKGQDHSIEPLEVSNENHIYTKIPRCAVSPQGITLQEDQLTSPYTNGQFQYEDEDNIISFISEFRRIPCKMTYELKYVLDSYTDTLECAQQIITKLAFIRNYKIVYLGQTINCSYKIPDSVEDEKLLEFDEATTDDRRRTITLSIEVETNLPVYNPRTVIQSDNYIKPNYANSGSNSYYGSMVSKDGKRIGGLRVMSQGGINRGEPGEDPHAPYPKKQDE